MRNRLLLAFRRAWSHRRLPFDQRVRRKPGPVSLPRSQQSRALPLQTDLTIPRCILNPLIRRVFALSLLSPEAGRRCERWKSHLSPRHSMQIWAGDILREPSDRASRESRAARSKNEPESLDLTIIRNRRQNDYVPHTVRHCKILNTVVSFLLRIVISPFVRIVCSRVCQGSPLTRQKRQLNVSWPPWPSQLNPRFSNHEVARRTR